MSYYQQPQIPFQSVPQLQASPLQMPQMNPMSMFERIMQARRNRNIAIVIAVLVLLLIIAIVIIVILAKLLEKAKKPERMIGAVVGTSPSMLKKYMNL